MWITLIIAAVLLFADQITKYLTEIFIDKYEMVEAIPNLLTLTKVYNKGAAWSFLSDTTWVLVIISFIGMFVLGYYSYKNDWKNKKVYSTGITMAFAGCVGNLIDRLISITPLSEGSPGVVDMISFEPLNWISQAISGYDFPTFNIADICLVVGMILIAIDVLIIDTIKGKNK
jgi:signal peptidase II